MSNILVVDDVKRDREMLAAPFRSAHDVRCVQYLDEACKLLDKWWPDVALVDAIFPKMQYAPPSFQAGSLLDMLEDKSSYTRRPQIIILSGQNDTVKKFDEVRSWLNDGRIQDVIAKATADMGVEFFEAVLQLRVENLLERRKWSSVQISAESAAEWFKHLGIITRSPKMLALREHLQAAARSDLSILLTGERGTGKTLLAQAIHNLTRPDKPFVELNSANIPPGLFNEELFGIKGDKKNPNHSVYVERKGHLERAADGTFFFDDIQNLADEHQNKLNQVLQGRKFVKVGGSEVSFRARFISATNEDLEAKVQQGKFRPDLYDRVNGLPIRIPKLSERGEDIPDLAESFLQTYVRERRGAGHHCPAMQLQPKCLDMFCAYEWPGNVRQLENLVKKVAAFAGVEDKDEVEISTELLLKLEPGLAEAVRPGSVFDGLLRDAGIGTGRWGDLTETQACESIQGLLTGNAKIQFELMLCALKPRARDAAPGSPGRASQDPATLHCLKALLYVLLCPEHSVSIQQLLGLLQVTAWATGKKVLNVLAVKADVKLEAAPSFAPFLKLPEAGAKRVAELLPGILTSAPDSALR